MSKQQLTSTGRWSRTGFYRLPTAEHKLIMIYLESCPLVNRSGVYRMYSGSIVGGLGEHTIGVERVKEILIELDEKWGMIKYDKEDHIIYIKDYHSVTPFGNGKPSIIAKDLLRQHEAIQKDGSLKLRELWIEYLKDNKDEIKGIDDKLKNPKSNSENISLKILIDIGLS